MLMGRRLDRRSILKTMGWAGMGLLVPGPLATRKFARAAETVFPFEEITGTGISWTHSNGRSPDMFLPETVGAGCAFFDYDNDGWMDIYLVNSGPCDFYQPSPPLRNALYRNNRDG